MRAEEQRVRKLQSEGRITRREADQIVAALERLEMNSRAARKRAGRFRRDLSPVGVLKARFLVGELTREELLHGFRRVTIVWGVMIALIGFSVHLLINFASDLDVTLNERALRTLWFGAWMGIIVGGSYYNQLKLSTRKLWRLRRKVDISRPELLERRPGHCASCGSEKLQRSLPRALFSAGWVLLPWVAIHELYLGQRLPRRFQRCHSCGAIHVACSRCEASVENLDWSTARPFWSADGMQCTNCDTRIPCWRNVFALAIQWPARVVAGLFGAKLDTRQTPTSRAR